MIFKNTKINWWAVTAICISFAGALACIFTGNPEPFSDAMSSIFILGVAWLFIGR